MARKRKIFVIIHLCLAFSFFFWLLLQPSLKDYLFERSQESLFKGIFEREEAFVSLPVETQTTLLDGLEIAFNRKGSPYFQALARLLVYDINPFALAWLFFSLAICFLLLFRIEGAHLAVWLLPIIVCAYAISCGFSAPKQRTDSLFPTENYVVDTYLNEPLSQRLSKRKEQLLGAWHRYIVTEWLEETPAEDPELLASQVSGGLYAFNVKRAERLVEGSGREDLMVGFFSPPSFIQLIFYLAWNVLFAWMVQERSKSAALSNPS